MILLKFIANRLATVWPTFKTQSVFIVGLSVILVFGGIVLVVGGLYLHGPLVSLFCGFWYAVFFNFFVFFLILRGEYPRVTEIFLTASVVTALAYFYYAGFTFLFTGLHTTYLLPKALCRALAVWTVIFYTGLRFIKVTKIRLIFLFLIVFIMLLAATLLYFGYSRMAANFVMYTPGGVLTADIRSIVLKLLDDPALPFGVLGGTPEGQRVIVYLLNSIWQCLKANDVSEANVIIKRVAESVTLDIKTQSSSTRLWLWTIISLIVTLAVAVAGMFLFGILTGGSVSDNCELPTLTEQERTAQERQEREWAKEAAEKRRSGKNSKSHDEEGKYDDLIDPDSDFWDEQLAALDALDAPDKLDKTASAKTWWH